MRELKLLLAAGYRDAGHTSHRDGGHHLQRLAVASFNHVRGTGAQRVH